MMRSEYRSTSRVILWLVSVSRCPKMFVFMIKKEVSVGLSQRKEYFLIWQDPKTALLLVCALSTDRSSCLSLRTCCSLYL